MIHKIQSLISIGKFRNYNATGSVHFNRLTLVYGSNGGGKTTLTAVLRSLTGNAPEIIRKRLSTNNTTPQAAQIITEGTPRVTHTFGSSGWTIPLSQIEIFDTHFINDNVYSGFDFNEDHKRQLHQFVVGAQGIAIQQLIEDNKAEKTRLRASIGFLCQQLIATVGYNMRSDMINAFLRTPSPIPTNIAQLIIDAENAVVNANANSVIQSLPLLSQAVAVTTRLDIPLLSTVLNTTIQDIQDNTLRAIMAEHLTHLSDHGLENPELWLKSGLDYLDEVRNDTKDNNVNSVSCPFCRQDTNVNLEIIRSYTSYFNEEFNNLVRAINNHQSVLISTNLDAMLQALRSVTSSNQTRIDSWTSRLPSGVSAPQFICSADETLLTMQFQNVIDMLTSKVANPTVAIDISPLSDFQTSIETLQASTAIYNDEVNTYNLAITTFRSTIQTATNAQNELDRLRRIEQRHSPTIDSICNQINTESQQLRTLEATYSQLSDQQQSAAGTFLTDYKDRVNYYLSNIFRTPFQIDGVGHVSPQGKSTQSKIGYHLTIHGHPIAFDNSQPLCAREVLSDGDRSTIALAFFLSKLDIDPVAHDKILVFDDPLSSLDSLRKAYTVSIIKRKLTEMKQVIVLSHNEYFLFEISKGISRANKQILRISESFNPLHQSVLEPCDLDDLVKSSYFRQLESLEQYQITPVPSERDSVVGWLRNVLETNLKFRFHNSLLSLSQPHTFSKIINHLDRVPVIFKNNASRQDIIDRLNLIDSISWRSHHGLDSPLEPRTEIDAFTISDAEVNSYIVDTLDLVYNQL